MASPSTRVIWGDIIGFWIISHDNRGMMAACKPSIDQIPNEGIAFTDSYGKQNSNGGHGAWSCASQITTTWSSTTCLWIGRS